MRQLQRSLKNTVMALTDRLIEFISKAKEVFENIWIKRIALTLVIIYSVWFLITQYNDLKESTKNITINYPLILLSMLIILITLVMNVYSLKQIISALGFKLTWMEIARVQMLSSLGKYIPGHIWNYSSKVYLLNKLGLPIKVSGSVVVFEILITYLFAISLFSIFIPQSIIPEAIRAFSLFIRAFGGITFIFLIITPFIGNRLFGPDLKIPYPLKMTAAMLIRAFIWVISSFAFLLLSFSLGFSNLDLAIAISAITTAFFAGFIAVFTPDGLIVRESVLVFFLDHLITSSNALILGLIFRFIILIVEFIVVFSILLFFKAKESK
jgi:glycosyltransferase 2 family protein